MAANPDSSSNAAAGGSTEKEPPFWIVCDCGKKIGILSCPYKQTDGSAQKGGTFQLVCECGKVLSVQWQDKGKDAPVDMSAVTTVENDTHEATTREAVTPTPSIRIVELPSPEQNAAADGDRATGVTTMATTSHGRFQIELTVRPVEDMEAGTGAFVNEMSGQLRLLNEMAAQVTSLGHENTRWTEVTGQIVSTHTGRETGREVLSTGGTTEAPAIAVPATAGSGAVDAQQQQRQTAMTTTPQVPQTQAYIQIPTVTVQQGYYVPAPIVPFSVHYYGSQDMAVGAVNYEMQALGIPVSSPGMIYY